MKININYYLLFGMLLCMLSARCKKSIEGIIEDESKNRAFVPSGLRARTSIDSAIITWNLPVLASGKKYSYTVDISTNSLFSKVDLTKVVDTTRLIILEPALALDTRYFTRVKVNAYKGSAESNYIYSPGAFRINGQQYLKMIRVLS